jgi:hypothetical protein
MVYIEKQTCDCIRVSSGRVGLGIVNIINFFASFDLNQIIFFKDRPEKNN